MTWLVRVLEILLRRQSGKHKLYSSSLLLASKSDWTVVDCVTVCVCVCVREL